MTERSTGHERHTPELTQAQLASLHRFVNEESPQTARDRAILDQGASTLREQFDAFGVKLETDAQFYVACIATVIAAENMGALFQAGISPEEARAYVRQTIAALRPLRNRCAPTDIEPPDAA